LQYLILFFFYQTYPLSQRSFLNDGGGVLAALPILIFHNPNIGIVTV